MINLRYKFHSNYDSISHLLDGKDPRIHKVSEEEYDDAASSKSKRNGVREVSDKSFKIFKRERVVTPLPF